MTFLTITDGYNKVEFDGTIFSITSYTPGVGLEIEDGLYNDVEDEVVFNVHASDPHAELRKLADLLNKARAQHLGRIEMPVIVVLQHHNSSAKWAARIKLSYDVNEALTLPQNYAESSLTKHIEGARLVFRRMGQWVLWSGETAIFDGGFETWEAGEPAYWSSTLDKGTIAQETSLVKAGDSSLKATGFEPDTDNVRQAIGPLHEGGMIYVSVWVYVTVGRATVYVRGNDYSYQSRQSKTVNQWEQIEFLAYVGNVAQLLYIACAPGETSATFFVDEAVVKYFNFAGDSVTSVKTTSVTNGAVATMTFGVGALSDEVSPVAITVEPVQVGGNHNDAYLIVSNQAKAISLKEAESITLISGFTTVADTTAQASGNTIVRLTTVSTSVYNWFIANHDDFSVNPQTIDVFACVRNNHATAQFLARLYYTTSPGWGFTNSFIIPAGVGRPRWIPLGRVRVNFSKFALYFNVKTTISGATLDIDRFCFVVNDDGLSHALRIEWSPTFGTASTQMMLVHDHRTLVAPRPQTTVLTDRDVPWPSRGEQLFRVKNRTIEGIFLATGGSTTADKWRQAVGTTLSTANWRTMLMPGRTIIS